jgi:hypothetical protein
MKETVDPSVPQVELPAGSSKNVLPGGRAGFRSDPTDPRAEVAHVEPRSHPRPHVSRVAAMREVISGPDKGRLADELARHIVAAVENPDEWKTALRREAERLGLNVARIDFSGCMRSAAWALVDEAAKQGCSPADVVPPLA